MDRKAPVLSVVIPTRNGGRYVGAAVQSVLDFGLSDMEILVSINHSDDDTAEVMSRFLDDRIRVVYPPELLNMPDHFEWCLTQVRGDWVSIVGDDDGYMPNFAEHLGVLLDRYGKEADAFIFRRAYYLWPGVRGSTNGEILYSSKDCITEVNGTYLVLGAILGPLSYEDLPMVYSGSVVRRSLVESIRVRSSGTIINEANPDVYTGVAVALSAKKIVRTETPTIWTGASPKSTAADNQGNSKEFRSQLLGGQLQVADALSPDLWLAARSSRIWTLSALLKVPFVHPLSRSRIRRLLLILTLANTLSSLRTGEPTASLVLQCAADNGVGARRLRWLSKLCPPFVRLWTLVRRSRAALHGRARAFRTVPDDQCNSLSEANVSLKGFMNR